MAPVVNGRLIFNEVPTGMYVVGDIHVADQPGFLRISRAWKDNCLRHESNHRPRDRTVGWRISREDPQLVDWSVYEGQHACAWRTIVCCEAHPNNTHLHEANSSTRRLMLSANRETLYLTPYITSAHSSMRVQTVQSRHWSRYTVRISWCQSRWPCLRDST